MNKLLVLQVGYPAVIFLLILLPSGSNARNLLIGVVIAYLFLDQKHFLLQLKELILKSVVVSGLMLILYASLSIFWSSPPLSVQAEDFIRYGFVVALFWLLSLIYFRNYADRLSDIYWVIGLGLIGNLVGSWYSGNALFQDNRLMGYGIIDNPILIGSIAVIQVVMGLHLKYRNISERILAWFMTTIAIAIVVLSGSRGPLIALVSVMMVWLICKPELTRNVKLALLITSALLVPLIIYTTGLMEMLQERGYSLRPLIWQETLQAVQQHWLIGWGWGNDFSLSKTSESILQVAGYTILHPHGLLISSLYYGGVIGLLTHIVFLAMVARMAFLACERSFALSLLLAVIMLTLADTHTVVSKRDFMWIIFWIPVSVIISLEAYTPNNSIAAQKT